MGPLVSLFWTSGDVPSEFQSQMGHPYLRLTEPYVLKVKFLIKKEKTYKCHLMSLKIGEVFQHPAERALTSD